MKLLITGATGFLGSHVVEALLRDTACDVVVALKDPTRLQAFPWGGRITAAQFDLSTPAETDWSSFGRPDLLIHFAWKNFRDIWSQHQITENLPDSYRFITQMATQGLPAAVVVGSGFEFGHVSGPLREEGPFEPNSPYAIAKDALRRLLATYTDRCKNGFRCAWVRIFNAYGPRQHPNSIFGLLDDAMARGDMEFPMSPGEQLRDYMHVEDLARLFVRVALDPSLSGSINCCSGSPVSMRRLSESYIAAKGSRIRLNLGALPYALHEPLAYWGDTTRLKELLAKRGASPLLRPGIPF